MFELWGVGTGRTFRVRADRTMIEKQDDVDKLDDDAGGDGCEFVDFEADTLARCRDDAQTYSIRGVAVALCETHLEKVLLDEGLIPESRATAGRAA